MTEDPVPLAEQIGRHRSDLQRFASRRLNDAALAEDLVQETLLAALQSADAWAERATLRTWLTAILQRRMADAWRQRQRSPIVAVAAGASDEDDDGPPQAEPVDWVDPSRRLEGRDIVAAVVQGLAALPPTAARLFALREIDGACHDEAARAVGLSPRHAAQLMHRTRSRLRDALARAGVA